MAEKQEKEEKKEKAHPPEEQKKDKQQHQQQAREEPVKGVANFTKAFRASVEEVIGRTGTRGEAIQVRCKVLEGRDQNKVLRRNIKGPVQLGDILMLRETEIEARELSKAGRGGGS